MAKLLKAMDFTAGEAILITLILWVPPETIARLSRGSVCIEDRCIHMYVYIYIYILLIDLLIVFVVVVVVQPLTRRGRTQWMLPRPRLRLSSNSQACRLLMRQTQPRLTKKHRILYQEFSRAQNIVPT